MGSILLGTIAAIWGILGVLLLLGNSVVRLAPWVLELFDAPLKTYHWWTLILYTGFMVVAEGIRGFQMNFSPRVVARALYLKKNPTVVRSILAPLFCMGYFHMTRPRISIVYGLSTVIVGLILIVRHLAQPWRGIVDAGVIAGLLWGCGCIVVFAIRAARTTRFAYPTFVPDEKSEASRSQERAQAP